MGQTLCVVAAGLLVGQVQEIPSANSGWTQVQTVAQGRVWTQTGTFTPTTGWTWKTVEAVDDRPFLTRISDRMGELLGSRQNGAKQKTTPPGNGRQNIEASLPIIRTLPSETQGKLGVPGTKVTLNEPPLLDETVDAPSGQSAQSANVKAASFQRPQAKVAASPANNSKIQAQGVGKIGHEEDYSGITGRVEMENGNTFVRYAAPEAADRFGGRMILNGELNLSWLRNGDLVNVQGSVIRGQSVSLYRAQSIELIERKAK